MFVVLNHNPFDAAGSGGARLAEIANARRVETPTACLDIGLLNNLPDAALRATERQFSDLLAAAARNPALLERFPSDAALRSGLIRGESASGVTVVANWLTYLASRKH